MNMNILNRVEYIQLYASIFFITLIAPVAVALWQWIIVVALALNIARFVIATPHRI